MALTIYWSKNADKRFDEILNYLESEWGDKSARLFTKKVFDILEVLKEWPEIGSLEKNELNIRGLVIVRQITLFYQVRADRLVLLNFYDTRQNPKKKKY